MEKYIENIEKYINGTLNESESKDFENELAVNEELQNILETYPIAKKAIQAGVEEDAYLAVLSARSNLRKEEKLHSRGRRLYLLVAACVIVLASVIGISYSNLYLTTPSIVRSVYNPPSDLSKFMGTESEDKAKELREIWDTGNLSEAISYASDWRQLEPNNKSLLYSLAHLYFQNENFTESKKLFEELSTGLRYVNDAEFHLALCEYMLGNNIEAEERLSTIAESNDHLFKDKAVEALNKFNNILRNLVI